MLDWLRQDAGIQAPLDKVALLVIFIVASYVPAMIAAIFYTALCKKPQYDKFDPASHVFNRPDAMEMAKVLQTVASIQQSVTKLQANNGNGAGQGSAQEEN